MYKRYLFFFLFILNANAALHIGVGGGIEVKNNIRKGNLVEGYSNKTIYRFFPTGLFFAGRFFIVDNRALLTLHSSKLLAFRLFVDYTGDEYLGVGMRHRRRSLYGGGSLSFVLLHFSVAADLLGRSNGMRMMLATGLAIRIGEFGRFSWRIGRQYYSSDYVDYYFGVENSEVMVGRSAYNGSSTGNFLITATYQYQLLKRLRLSLALSYKKFGSEIEKSPTVSSPEQYSTLFWGTFTF